MQICSISDCRSFDALRNKTPSMPGGWEPSQDREQESVGGQVEACGIAATTKRHQKKQQKSYIRRDIKGSRAPQCQKPRSAKSSAVPKASQCQKLRSAKAPQCHKLRSSNPFASMAAEPVQSFKSIER